MRCIYCGEKTRTANSRRNSAGYQIWRRRRCTACGAVFTSGEQADLGLALRVKTDSSLEPFQYEKLYLAVYESLSHRKTACSDAKGLTATVIARLIPSRTGIVSADEIKETVFPVLKRFDKAAGTHYRAHHL